MRAAFTLLSPILIGQSPMPLILVIFSFSSTPVPADVFLIAVPTPFRIGIDGIPQPNIDFVLVAARAIAPVLRPGNLVLFGIYFCP